MMKSPIIVVESNDIGVYRSPEHALSHLELYDIKKGIYTAYGAARPPVPLPPGPHAFRAFRSW